MKVKLLKKIRKRYSILYYPKGVPYFCFQDDKIKTRSNKYRINNLCSYESKEEALEAILRVVRKEYQQYSVRFKREQGNNKPIKVWYK